MGRSKDSRSKGSASALTQTKNNKETLIQKDKKDSRRGRHKSRSRSPAGRSESRSGRDHES